MRSSLLSQRQYPAQRLIWLLRIGVRVDYASPRRCAYPDWIALNNRYCWLGWEEFHRRTHNVSIMSGPSTSNLTSDSVHYWARRLISALDSVQSDFLMLLHFFGICSRPTRLPRRYV
jgi:hypothetical protein